MSHRHDLNCLEERSGQLYCKVTGEGGEVVISRRPEPTTPIASVPTESIGHVIPFPGNRPPASVSAPTPTFAAPIAPPPRTDRPRRPSFLIYGPDEGTRMGGNLYYKYSIPTFEQARGKALEILKQRTRTPYVTIATHEPGKPTVRQKVTRAELGPVPSKQYIIRGTTPQGGWSEKPLFQAASLSEIKRMAEKYLRETGKESVDVHSIVPGQGSAYGKMVTTVYAKSASAAAAGGAIPADLSRANTIRLIREGLKKRSGKEWSVSGGSGTAYGWIHISSPPKRQVGGVMTPEDAAELGRLLGLDRSAHHQYHSIPSSHDYYIEYIDRAWGRTPRKYGEPYWD